MIHDYGQTTSWPCYTSISDGIIKKMRMNLYSLHVQIAVHRSPLLSAPLVGIGILHFTNLSRFITFESDIFQNSKNYIYKNYNNKKIPMSDGFQFLDFPLTSDIVEQFFL